MLSGRGLCDELITRPEESYRLWCVVVCDLETSRIGAPYMYDISSLRVKGVNATGRGDTNIGRRYLMHEKSGNIELYLEVLHGNA